MFSRLLDYFTVISNHQERPLESNQSRILVDLNT